MGATFEPRTTAVEAQAAIFEPRTVAVEADAFTTRPTRRKVEGSEPVNENVTDLRYGVCVCKWYRAVCFAQRDSVSLHLLLLGSPARTLDFFFFFFFFFAFPSYISGVHHFWVRFCVCDRFF